MPGLTIVKGLHVSELRSAIDDARARRGLAAYAWTDAVLTAGLTAVRAVHLIELRTALNEVYTASGATTGGKPLPVYTNPTIIAGVTVITALDLTELRAAILAIW